MRSSKIWLVGLLVSVIIGFFTVGTVHAQLPDLTMWDNSWFKLTVTEKLYEFPDQTAKPSPTTRVVSTRPAYLHITAVTLDPGPPESISISADLFIKDPLTGDWNPVPLAVLDLEYFAGDDLKFVCRTFINTTNVRYATTIYFSGVLTTSGLDLKNTDTTMATKGSTFTQVIPATPQWLAGELNMSGTKVAESTVPTVLTGL